MNIPNPLRAITLWQPWAWALIFAGKDVENRPRSLGVTGWIAVHVGLYKHHTMEDAIWTVRRAVHRSRLFGMGATREHEEAAAIVTPGDLDKQRGHIIGLVDIEAWYERADLTSAWLDPTPGWAAVIRDRRALPDPLLCKEGFHRGVWRVPELVEGQIREQLLWKGTP